MTELTDWKVQKRAGTMSRRYDFGSYDEVGDFLDSLEALSEQEDFYPDLTFTRSYVSVSIKSRDEQKLEQVDFDFAMKVDQLFDGREQS